MLPVREVFHEADIGVTSQIAGTSRPAQCELDGYLFRAGVQVENIWPAAFDIMRE